MPTAKEVLLEAAEYFLTEAATCRWYGGGPKGRDPAMHSDAHDYCHAMFAAADWCRRKEEDLAGTEETKGTLGRPEGNQGRV